MLTLALAGIGLVILVLLLTTSVPASPSCLTQAEARAKWPRDHLYWHTRHRCWDNRAKGVVHETVKPSEGHEMRPRPGGGGAVKIVRWQDYNELDAAADRDQYFRHQTVALWPPFFDTWNYLWNRLWRPDDGRQ